MTRTTVLTALCYLLLTACSPGEPGIAQRESLSAGFLLGSAALENPVATSAYKPSPAGSASNQFEGRLLITPAPGEGHIKVITDWFGYHDTAGLKLADLPVFDFEFVQDGNDLVPLRRGPQASAHPHWEYILEPGKVWDDPQQKGWTRAALPFALQERNANCIHNGLLSFLFRNDGSISRLVYQVGSETCRYFQADLWGVLQGRYIPAPIENARLVKQQFAREISARLPVKPLSDLAVDYPGSAPENFDWYPPGEVSTFGFAIDGVHYSGGCQTRHGPYPFCAELDLPSYSLAKSIFAGMAYMVLKQEFPGVGESRVDQFVPECAADERWKGVTLAHLLDMRSGNFESLEADADEFASYESAFMSSDSHAAKISTSCELFPRKADPGSTFAYHTSDTYIAGTLMNGFLQDMAAGLRAAPRDIHADVLVEEVMKPLGLSPVTWFTRRTYDDTAQPFTGYGLTLHSDDIVRLGLFLVRGDGIVNGEQVLDPAELNAALQRATSGPSLAAGSEKQRYRNGFWAYRSDLRGACKKPVWIPYMSGYGGISVALLPNQSVFYVFSDNGRFEWLNAAVESGKIKNYCGS